MDGGSDEEDSLDCVGREGSSCGGVDGLHCEYILMAACSIEELKIICWWACLYRHWKMLLREKLDKFPS